MEEVWNVDRTGAVEGSGRSNAEAGSRKQQWLREKETQKDRNSFLVTVFEVLRGRWRKEISACQCCAHNYCSGISRCGDAPSLSPAAVAVVADTARGIRLTDAGDVDGRGSNKTSQGETRLEVRVPKEGNNICGDNKLQESGCWVGPRSINGHAAGTCEKYTCTLLRLLRRHTRPQERSNSRLDPSDSRGMSHGSGTREKMEYQADGWAGLGGRGCEQQQKKKQQQQHEQKHKHKHDDGWPLVGPSRVQGRREKRRLLVGCAGVPLVDVGWHIQHDDRIHREVPRSNKYKIATASHGPGTDTPSSSLPRSGPQLDRIDKGIQTTWRPRLAVVTTDYSLL
ncbi:hypothetical protein B0J15DRAFT_458137 [Fusarium solani]|uniref:Uncharacterized protein n=1 Tax=Fusarium solani TaxID=169388 RepID=A0A9P9L8Y8_FUSSL|nr:uncharacterized protein B0J15DRAFT_458137 [Fusarium solani]KAH7276004.1 hypothetical protein B0J15DRAFT_458137 [Fusarium solani]